MLINHISGATRTLGKSQGYLGLPVRDQGVDGGVHEMVSSWSPTPKELEALNSGACIYLRVQGLPIHRLL
jgi:hypothetical protein